MSTGRCFDDRLFRRAPSLVVLNVIAVAATLGVTNAVILVHLDGLPPSSTGVPSFLAGGVLFTFVRLGPRRSSFAAHGGWLSCVAAALLGVLLATAGGARNNPWSGFFEVAYALVTSAVLLPLACSWRLARTGVAGQERGEGMIALVCLVTLGVTMLWMQPMLPATEPLALTGAAAAVGVMMTCAWRERRRDAFATLIAAGLVPGLRVERVPEGMAVVRSREDTGYREAPFEVLGLVDRP